MPEQTGILTEFYETELQKCKQDIFYFLENYTYVVGIDPATGIKGRIKFKLFDYQKRYIKTVLENKYTVIDKPRQTGFSTVSAGICLWYAAFKSHKEVSIVSINDKEAMYFLDRVRFMYDECPKFLVGGLLKATEHKMNFDNHSSIEALATTKKALRGRSPSLTIIDEIAFNQFADEMMGAALPSLIHGDHLVLISTRNGTEGIGHYYYKTLEDAQAKENEFVPFEAFWWECPLYNKQAPKPVDWKENDWAMKQYRALGEKKFKQEILKEWILAGDTVLPQSILETLQRRIPIRTDFIRPTDVNPDEAEGLNEAGWDEEFLYAKGFWVWEEPVEGRYYCIGADLSTGRGDDYSTAVVIDVSTMTQVAEYKFRIPTAMFSKIILEIGNYYNNAFIAIETNADETAVNNLEQVGYEALYYRMQSKKFIAGWNTNNKSRGMLVSHLQDTLLHKRVEIVSYRLISELKTFVYRLGRAQHAKKCNDDLVFGFMIADYVIEDYVNQQGIDIEVSTRKVDEAGQRIGITHPIPPIISEQTLNINNGDLKVKSKTKGNVIDITKINFKEDPFEKYDINTEHYAFVGLKPPKKKEDNT